MASCPFCRDRLLTAPTREMGEDEVTGHRAYVTRLRCRACAADFQHILVEGVAYEREVWSLASTGPARMNSAPPESPAFPVYRCTLCPGDVRVSAPVDFRLKRPSQEGGVKWEREAPYRCASCGTGFVRFEEGEPADPVVVGWGVVRGSEVEPLRPGPSKR